MINNVNRWLLFVGEVCEHVLNITPFDLVCNIVTIFYIKNHFFYKDCTFYLRILYSSFVYEMNVREVILYFVYKWSKMYLFITKSIKSWKNGSKLLPILLSKYTTFIHKVILLVFEAYYVRSIYEKNIQEFNHCEFIVVLMCKIFEDIKYLMRFDIIIQIEKFALIEEGNYFLKTDIILLSFDLFKNLY